MANTKVTGDVIANGTISTVHLADNAITAAKLDSTATGITFADLTVDTDTLYVDAANNRVGIGTTSPHNDVSGLSISVASSTDQLYLERTGSGTGRYYLGTASNSFYIVDDAQSATRMVIDSSGNFGIGTASPSTKLHIDQPSNDRAGGLYIERNGSNYGLSAFVNSGGYGVIGSNGSVTTDIITMDLSNGNVGIGTSPAEKLHIRDASTDADVYIKIANDSRDWFMGVEGSNSDILSFKTHDASNLLNITSAGNVGIGEQNPATALEVKSSELNSIFVSNPTTSGATIGSGIGFKAYNGSSVTQSAGIILTSNTWSFGTYSANQLSVGSDGTGGLALRSANSAPITFYTGGSTAGLSSERMRINSSGNVGIGVVPNAVTAGNIRLDVGYVGCGITSRQNAELVLTSNADYTTATTTGRNAIMINLQNDGNFSILNAPSTTAGSALTFTPRFYINTSGNVGIGTTSPLNKFDLRGTAYVTGYTVGFDTSPQGNYAYRLTNDGANSFINVLGGNLGIGTASPSYKLDVAGEIGLDSYLRHNGDSDTFFGFSGNDEIKFRTAGSDRIFINSSGNVGIGTTTPEQDLHIKRDGEAAVISLERINSNAGYLLLNGSINPNIAYPNNQDLRFATVSNIAFDGFSERMRINSQGQMWLGGSYTGSNIANGNTSYMNNLNAGSFSILHRNSSDVYVHFNSYYTNSNTYVSKYSGRGFMLGYNAAVDTGFFFSKAPNTTAGQNQTFSQVMTVGYGTSNNVGIGTTSPGSKLEVKVADTAATTDYATKVIKAVAPLVGGYTGTKIISLLGGYDGTIPAVDFGYGYNTVGYDIMLSTNDNTTGNPIERMRITSGGNTLIGMTSEQNAGRLQIDSGASENGGILDVAGSGWYRYYTRVCRNSTSAQQAGYWHIKTNIVANSNTMFLAKFYGYIYGSGQILDLTHAGYAYSGSSTVINQGTTNNGSDPNASSAVYISANGSKVTFRIAFGTGSNFSTYFAGVTMDIAFLNPAGQGHDFEIEAQAFSTNTNLY
jgi:hypothetical protein